MVALGRIGFTIALKNLESHEAILRFFRAQQPPASNYNSLVLLHWWLSKIERYDWLGASLHPTSSFQNGSQFVDVSESEIDQFKQNAVPKKKKRCHKI